MLAPGPLIAARSPGQRAGEIDALDIGPQRRPGRPHRTRCRSITAAICRASAISTVAIECRVAAPDANPRRRQPMGSRQEAATNASRVTITSPAAVRRTRLTVPTYSGEPE